MSLLSLISADVATAIANKTTVYIVVYGNPSPLLHDLQTSVQLKPRMAWSQRNHVLKLFWKKVQLSPLAPAPDGTPITALSLKNILLAQVTVLSPNSTAGCSPQKLYLTTTNNFIETEVVAPMSAVKGTTIVRLY